MKLVCINSREIEIWFMHQGSPTSYIGSGDGLVEGEIYTSNKEILQDELGNKCYYIEELGELKMCIRFRDIDKSFGDYVAMALEAELNRELV